jgi:hypothetical protein
MSVFDSTLWIRFRMEIQWLGRWEVPQPLRPVFAPASNSMLMAEMTEELRKRPEIRKELERSTGEERRLQTPAGKAVASKAPGAGVDWVAYGLCSLRLFVFYRPIIATNTGQQTPRVDPGNRTTCKTVGQPLRLPRQAMRLPYNSFTQSCERVTEFTRNAAENCWVFLLMKVRGHSCFACPNSNRK